MRIAPIKFAACQFNEDFLDKRRNLIQHILELINLSFLLVNIFLYLDSSLLIFRSLIKNSLLFLIVFFELLILSSEMMININQVVNFLIENINICKKIIILFFSLDKSVLNLQDVS